MNSASHINRRHFLQTATGAAAVLLLGQARGQNADTNPVPTKNAAGWLSRNNPADANRTGKQRLAVAALQQ